MSQELLRIVEAIARDKNIDKEVVFEDLEAAMLSAIRKAYQKAEDIVVRIDRETGDITARIGDQPLSMQELGRIPAQAAKQVMIQKIREAERDSIYEEYLDRRGQIVIGRVARTEGSTLIVDLGRAEAILPKAEQIPGESHKREDRIRAMVLEVRDLGSQVRIVLSRSHPQFVRRLFELEVPEVAEKIIEIRALAREAGYRTKVAVHSLDPKVDAVGACVGVRGSRIKSIVDELGGEKIDIVRWNDSSKILIANALKPAEVYEIYLCFELGRAIVVVTEDQLSLAIGKRGQNVRLATKLTQWEIDILTPAEFSAGLDVLERTLEQIDGVDRQIVSQIIALGMVTVLDVEEVGPEPLIKELHLDRSLAEVIVTRCSEQARRMAESAASGEQAQAEAATDGGVPGEPEAAAAEAGAASAQAPPQAGAETGVPAVETAAESAGPEAAPLEEQTQRLPEAVRTEASRDFFSRADASPGPEVPPPPRQGEPAPDAQDESGPAGGEDAGGEPQTDAAGEASGNPETIAEPRAGSDDDNDRPEQ